MEKEKFVKETPFGTFEVEILNLNYTKHYEKQIEANINGEKYHFDFVSRGGKNGMRICQYNTEKVLGKKINQDVIFTFPFDLESKIIAEFSSIKTAFENAKRDHYENLISGKKNFIVEWQEGDPLSGWVVRDNQAENILKDLGLAKDVSGWGVIINSAFIQSVGKNFTYQQAFEYTQPKREEKAAKERVKEEKIQKIFAEAKETGKPVEISRYLVDCDDQEEECSTDIVIEWAYPNGTKKITKNHTW